MTEAIVAWPPPLLRRWPSAIAAPSCPWRSRGAREGGFDGVSPFGGRLGAVGAYEAMDSEAGSPSVSTRCVETSERLVREVEGVARCKYRWSVPAAKTMSGRACGQADADCRAHVRSLGSSARNSTNVRNQWKYRSSGTSASASHRGRSWAVNCGCGTRLPDALVQTRVAVGLVQRGKDVARLVRSSARIPSP